MLVAALVLVPGDAAPMTTAHVQQKHGPQTYGHWSVQLRATGEWLVWRAPGLVPVTDGRPEFRLGGQTLGYPEVGSGGRSLALPVAALDGADLSRVEAWIGLRRLDSAAPSLPASGRVSTAALRAAAVRPAQDPGRLGPHAVDTFEYDAADLPWPAFDAPMEVLAHVVLPVGVDHAPLVLFLHGRHMACYRPDGGDDPGFWPCVPGSVPVPSYRGYDYLQRVLASQGYATVSISADGVNAQDGVTDDGGAGARAALVRHHLDLLARWSADPADQRWHGRLDLNRVVLVGHSRGGEGVDQAAIDTDPGAPYHLVGQVLLAPTDFAQQTAPYLPTEVVLPYCDGDVSDLQGQRYVDAGPLLDPSDPALRSSVLLLGANHNYFNTEWTPGAAAAPSLDDWWDPRDPLCGRKVSATRLTAQEQRRAAKRLVAAGVHAFVGDDVPGALAYLDAPDPVDVPRAGPALALTATLGGDRDTVRVDHGAQPDGSALTCAAGQPTEEMSDADAAPLCGPRGWFRQPHWTPADTASASVHAAYAASGLPADAVLRWSSPGVEGGLAVAAPVDLTGADRSLDLRVVVDPQGPPVEVQVVLGSEDRSWAGPVVTLSPLPGSPVLAALWGQTLRVDPADFAGHLDLAQVDSVRLRTVSEAGRLWLLDASVRTAGLAPVPDRRLPRVHVGRIVQPEGGFAAAGVALLPFTVSGVVTEPAELAVAADQTTWEGRAPAFETVTIQPGQTEGRIPVRYEADELDDLPAQTELVHTVPRSGLVTSGFLGRVVVRDDDPAPEVTFSGPRHVVRYGDDLVFRLALSAPIDYWAVNTVRAVRREEHVPLRTSDVPHSWLRAQLGMIPDDVALWRVWHFGFVDLPPGRRHVELGVPTLRHPLHPRGKVLDLRLTAQHLTGPLHAAGRVGSRR